MTECRERGPGGAGSSEAPGEPGRSSNFPSPSRYCSGAADPGPRPATERRAVLGVGKAGGLCESSGEIFPPLGSAKLTFLQQLSWLYSLRHGAID